MPMKPGVRDALWMASGAAAFLVLMLVLLHVHKGDDPAEQIASKARRIELVDRMRAALASASEAEKSAVLAITDEDSQRFAEEARAAGKTVEEARQELGGLLQPSGSDRELFGQFSRAFADFRRIDDDLLSLAIKNTNLKAYALAYGPAGDALKEMTDALSRLATASVDSQSSAKMSQLALGAAIAALRVQTMLPPHIAERNDEKMDQMEASMTMEEEEVRKDLEALVARPELRANSELRAAASSWARFRAIKVQILALSRENTNVRSLTISLDRKRKVMLLCQDTLAALRQVIEEEPIRGVTYGVPVKPR